MAHSMNAEHYGLRQMRSEELLQVNGGEATALPTWLRRLGGISVVLYVSDHWDEIKREFSAGWNIDNKK